MLDRMQTHPWEAIALVRQFARLHAAMHAEERAELPSGRESLRRRIARAPHLSNPQRQQLLATLERLPDGRAVCHGDFHPGNVLITSRGPLVIDWMTASHGHPLADVARTMILLQGAGPLPEPLPVRLRILLAMRRMLQRVYLREYFHLRPGCKEEMEKWIPLQAAARLNEEIPGEKAELLARIEKGLADQPLTQE
jgi:aminoglycoside phosphotransferase (APT) family kinase protein